MDRLMVDNVTIEAKEQIKQETLDFFENLYTELEVWRLSVNFEGTTTITEEEKVELEKPLEEEEIKAAIDSSSPGKAPGPDGYTMAFFQKSLDFIKPDFIAAINHYHQPCWMVRSCNASFIALIPKEKSPMELTDYRPISLNEVFDYRLGFGRRIEEGYREASLKSPECLY